MRYPNNDMGQKDRKENKFPKKNQVDAIKNMKL